MRVLTAVLFIDDATPGIQIEVDGQHQTTVQAVDPAAWLTALHALADAAGLEPADIISVQDILARLQGLVDEAQARAQQLEQSKTAWTAASAA